MNLRKLYRDLTTDDIVNGPPLRRRILYTALLLLLFRILADIPILNADEKELDRLLADNPLIGLVDLFAGGEVLKHFSLVAAGIFPYLIALTIATAATWLVPKLRELRCEGEEGRKRIERYALWLTIPLAFAFGWAVSHFLAKQTGLFPGRIKWFSSESVFPTLWVVCLVTLGSLVSTAISKLITTKGVGEGESIVLLAGSSLVFAKEAIRFVGEERTNDALAPVAMAALVGIAIVVLSIYIMHAVRRVPIVIPRQTTAVRRFGSFDPHIPLLINHGGMLPVASAAGVLSLLELAEFLLATYAGGWFADVGHALVAWATPSDVWYWIALAILIVCFTFLCNYSALWLSAHEGPSLAEQLKRNGTFIPGHRPGGETHQYLMRLAARIAVPAAIGLVLIAVVAPCAILRATGRNVLVAVVSLLVMVKTLETVRRRIEAFGSMESYEGLIRRPRRVS